MRQIIHYIKEVSTYNQVCTKEVLTFSSTWKPPLTNSIFLTEEKKFENECFLLPIKCNE